MSQFDSNEESKEDTHVITQAHFSCDNCASDLVYSPSSQNLKCRNCGHQYPIGLSDQPIKEYNFESAVHDLALLRQKDPANNKMDEQIEVIQCPSCGAEFTFKDNQHAGDCPYCATPIIVGTSQARYIVPRSLLPFKVEKKQALNIYDEWISSRWFAPSALKSHSNRNDKLVGIFLPYWTYDSQTYSNYRGQQGTNYYVQQTYSTTVKGQHVQRVRTVQKIKWRPVSGHIKQHFDDVLIGATKTLPRTIIDHLQPWDLDNLVPYSAEYISGFRSEIYQVTVDQGFLQAENIMAQAIKRSAMQDIGGDHQRISAINTQHKNTQFKHILLPVWSASFEYRGKSYRYVINGRNGTIQGERPYSFVKITFAVISALIVLGLILFFVNENGIQN